MAKGFIDKTGLIDVVNGTIIDQEGVITLDDLSGFSDDLRERLAFVIRDR